MVSTVTGVAPFVSMLRYWLEGPADDRRMYVLEGASFHDEFGYDDELAALAERAQPTCASCRRARDPAIRATSVGTGKSGACTRSSSDYVREWELKPAETLHLRLRPPANDRGSARPLRGHGLRVRGRAVLEAALECGLRRSRGRVPYRRRERRHGDASTDRTLRCVAARARGSRGCGGGGGGGGDDGGGAPAPPASGWVAGSFLPAASFAGRCVNPRSRHEPGQRPAVHRHPRHGDSTRTTGCARGATSSTSGTTRSSIAIQVCMRRRQYFDLLKTTRRRRRAAPKDRLPLHVSDDGLARARCSRARKPATASSGPSSRALPPRRIVVAYTHPSSPARDRRQPAARRGSRRSSTASTSSTPTRKPTVDIVRRRPLSGSAGRDSHVRAAQSADGLAANRDA